MIINAHFINPFKIQDQKYYDLIFENELNEIIYRGHLSFPYVATNQDMENRCNDIVYNLNLENEEQIVINQIHIDIPQSWQF